MKRSIGCALLISLGLMGCGKEIAYNSNSGFDGTRDTASQLLINTSKVDSCDAKEGDNEDWYYVNVIEEGKLALHVFVDKLDGLSGELHMRDGFGRSVETQSLSSGMQQFEFKALDVKPGRYFFNIACKTGASAYTVKADFTLPPPPVVIDVVPVEPEPEPSPSTPSRNRGSNPKTVVKPPIEDDEVPEGANIVTGTIVLVTPGDDDISRVTIRGVGHKYNIKKGAKGVLRGLKRQVSIYSCENTKCMGTVRATAEDLKVYDKVDVIVP